MSASPIPRPARPVVWFIRWWVKKPRTLPKTAVWFTDHGKVLRWGFRCPLGKLPMACSEAPETAPNAGLTPRLQKAIEAFYHWWDSQTDARAAVDAVWGKG